MEWPRRWSAIERTQLLRELSMHLAVCAVPLHLHGGLVRYLVDGILPGSFLQACLCNNLVEVARRGDPSSLVGLPGVMAFLEYYAPPASWGSRDHVLAWTTTADRLEIAE